MLQPGDRVPTFTLLDQHNNKWRLTDHAKRRVALFFYPKANTSGCTQQASELRDLLPRLHNVTVVGVSADEPDKQAKWDDKHQFNYPLLSDPTNKVAKKYGVYGPKKLYGREYEGITRSMFLISPTGRLEKSWLKISPAATAPALLDALDELND
ncbi:MAG: peroxiredoxin [Acidimicrobiales bacterium]|jgi:peroxiredoxin Q/BCP|nr:thioredoxin-dependent thiol peroxidase [Acidimicrobiaceae bacterium]MBR81072.1 thioredoxin-dependent thiol peroxidase [Acidimicrobiaceae bacterium]MEC7427006.1 peroxiredoxin [Actinomycetota bacterium]MEC9088735.1 peroxiredoxin [Actinomycetota bacterium]HAQ44144.1 thioredoxin-dependent thiol peroxidase [Acidimicrobiaceae bacterium]|tara:strand:+ start:1668 stop:2129 length:462 start_codon:yes stop_codon:yes gene_type:complete